MTNRRTLWPIPGRKSPAPSDAQSRSYRTWTVRFISALVFSLVAIPVMAASPGCPGTGTSAEGYKIGPGDVLHVSVWQNKNLNQIVTVLPDGMISLPLVNAIRAAGRTPMQLQGVIAGKLGSFLTNPQVTVVVEKVNSFNVSVLGQVQHPGRYAVNNDNTTVLDLLAQAGGFTSFANKGGIGVLRNTSNGVHNIHFKYKKAVSSKPGTADFCVQPGDIIVVP